MKIYSCYTDSHNRLYHDFFEATMPPELESISYFIDSKGDGEFLEEDFMEAIRTKIRLVADSIKENMGCVIIWSDVDIIFVRNPAPIIQGLFDRDDHVDILFQKENIQSDEINAGFIAMRCSELLLTFIKLVMFEMERNRHCHDQKIINHLLQGRCPIKWGYLPMAFYARSHGWTPPDDLIIYHANCTVAPGSVQQKICQFENFFNHYGMNP